MDIRERYEQVVRRVDAARQKQLEARANHSSLMNRMDELSKEAAALGVADISQLDSNIQSLESEIGEELAKIEQDLLAVESGNVPQQKLSGTIQPKQNQVLDIESLLDEGGQSTRKIP